MNVYINTYSQKIKNITFWDSPKIITQVLTNEPIAALTFDDGPDPVYTPIILKVLKQYDAKATFFMIGKFAQKHPDIVKLIAKNRHTIGNHSWDHVSITKLSFIERFRQLLKCQRSISPYGKKLFRPPYGYSTKRINFEVILQKYKIIGWSVDPKDWSQSRSDILAEYIKHNIRKGSIVLLHDRVFGDSGKNLSGMPNKHSEVDRYPMIYALENVLNCLEGKIKFVTIPELLNSGVPQQ